jgi:hypothetical protein
MQPLQDFRTIRSRAVLFFNRFSDPVFAPLILVLALFAYSQISEAKDLDADSSRDSEVSLDFPVLEMPFNFENDGYSAPSMRQSLAFSTDAYMSMHRALAGPEGSPRWRRWLVVGGDFLSSWVPLGNGWLHEEWHRAAMTRRGISSRNDIYTFPVGSTLIAVSHVSDRDLINLKNSHPYEQVRLSSAGMESQVAQNTLIGEKHFFDNAQTYDRMLMMFNAVNVSFYLKECGSTSADSSTDKQNTSDGTSVSKRDFTGLDCTAWAYDLFRPTEPYQARGNHPSGVGVDRYIRYSDLTDREKRFIKKQFYFSLFNFADPFLVGYDSFRAHAFDRDIKWNARTAHYITSFGYTIDANLYLQWDQRKLALHLHNGFNANTYFPGVGLEWREQALPGERFFLSHKLTVWQQPRGQDVRTNQGSWMVDAMERLSYIKDTYRPYVGIEAKTPGWMVGNPYLERNVTLWTGLEVSAF